MKRKVGGNSLWIGEKEQFKIELLQFPSKETDLFEGFVPFADEKNGPFMPGICLKGPSVMSNLFLPSTLRFMTAYVILGRFLLSFCIVRC
jgi:hypothetical protein